MELRVALQQLLEQNSENTSLKKYMRYYPMGLYPFPEGHPLYSDYLEAIDVPSSLLINKDWGSEIDVRTLYRLAIGSCSTVCTLKPVGGGALSLHLSLTNAGEVGDVDFETLSLEQAQRLTILYLKEQLLLEAATLKQDGEEGTPRPIMQLQSELRSMRQARLKEYREKLRAVL